jgi:hypothetical protein
MYKKACMAAILLRFFLSKEIKERWGVGLLLTFCRHTNPFNGHFDLTFRNLEKQQNIIQESINTALSIKHHRLPDIRSSPITSQTSQLTVHSSQLTAHSVDERSSFSM